MMAEKCERRGLPKTFRCERTRPAWLLEKEVTKESVDEELIRRTTIHGAVT